ncbi:MAG TPA: dienelactone hydrolase family protein [Casimicrobiaceae bacterium]|nr:dienelactone hydrolase family protein [Casimicrobiaceae bacterium]
MTVDAAVVTMPVADGEMSAYRALPPGDGPFPTVLVVQEIFGVHDWIKAVCRRLAEAGYFAIAPDLYARQGDATKISDTGALIRDIVSKVADAQVMGDLDAAVRYARSTGKADVARLGITGFCWGGRIVWMYAGHNPALKAAVPWYGPVARAYREGDMTALDIVPRIEAKVLGLYGGDDPGIPNDTTARIGEAMKAAGKTAEIVTYPETPHGFLADYRPSYRKGPAEDGWKRMLDWFGKYLR